MDNDELEQIDEETWKKIEKAQDEKFAAMSEQQIEEYYRGFDICDCDGKKRNGNILC